LRARSSLADDLRKVSARDAPERIEVPGTGGLDDFRGERWWRRLAVPAPRAPDAVQVVAQRLLVEARLRAARTVPIRRPEARAVRRHHLVDERRTALAITPELELRIRDDDPALLREVAPAGVDHEAQALQ